MKKIKVEVKKDFQDKYTGLKHKAGVVLEITEARYLEIKRFDKTLIEVVKANAEKAKEK